MVKAVEEDLAALRTKLGKKATKTDVVRAWARIGNRTRLVVTLADYQARLEEVARHAEAATREANTLRRRMAGLDAKQGKERGRAIDPALRALRAPANGHLRAHLEQLVREEAAGLPASTSNLILAKARRELGSWRALQDLLQPPTGQ